MTCGYLSQKFVLLFGGCDKNGHTTELDKQFCSNGELLINKISSPLPVSPETVVKTLRDDIIQGRLRANVVNIVVSLGCPDEFQDYDERVALMLDSIFIQYPKTRVTLLGGIPSNNFRPRFQQIFHEVLKDACSKKEQSFFLDISELDFKSAKELNQIGMAPRSDKIGSFDRIL